VDTKVQVYSKFRKKQNLKRVKSPISMRKRTFNTPKYRGKLQIMGVMCTHSPKLPKKIIQKSKKMSKNKAWQAKHQLAAAGD
jgi:hypothetical protein